jgi:hypothetical protein
VLNPEGHNQHTRGRPAGQKPHRVVLWDLQQAAKKHSKEGLNILLGCMRDPKADWGHRLRAIELMWAYGYGKPQVSVAVDTTHRFAYAVVPAVMSKEAWLAEVTAEQAEKRAGESLKGVAEHSKEPETIDLEAEPDPRINPDPTKPREPGERLN